MRIQLRAESRNDRIEQQQRYVMLLDQRLQRGQVLRRAGECVRPCGDLRHAVPRAEPPNPFPPPGPRPRARTRPRALPPFVHRPRRTALPTRLVLITFLIEPPTGREIIVLDLGA